LENKLTSHLDEVKAAIKKNAANNRAPLEIGVHKNAKRELAMIMSALFDANVPVYKINTVGSIGDIVYVQICYGDVEKIINQIRSEKNHLSEGARK
jgi:hypothetical protein